MKLNDIISLIKNGENEMVEFKERMTRNIHHEITAMANAKGGVILIGVNDRGEIVGTDTKRDKEVVSSSIQSITPPPAMNIETHSFGSKKVLIIHVARSDSLCSIGGVVHIRIGTSIRPLSLQEILILTTELGTFEWDSIPVLPRSEISQDHSDAFFKAYERARGIFIDEKDRDRFLRSRGAIKNDKLTNAGVLIFTPSSEHLAQSVIRIIFTEQGTTTGEMVFKGPVWKAVDDSYEAIVREVNRRKVLKGTKMVNLLDIPTRILREALINAVVHRNYSVQADVLVFMDRSSISIKNPGGLLPGVDINDPIHIPRNPSLCNLMYDMGYIERYGSGLTMMRDESKGRPGFHLDIRPGTNRFEVSMEVNDPEVDLDRRDKMILSLLETEMRSGELARRLGLSIPAVVNRLNVLISRGLVRRSSRGPRTSYRRV